MDPEQERKVHAAMEAASAIANARHLTRDEGLQFIADFLMNHPDPDVRAFQEAHNRHVRKDLN
jgi:hypothetical protein